MSGFSFPPSWWKQFKKKPSHDPITGLLGATQPFNTTGISRIFPRCYSWHLSCATGLKARKSAAHSHSAGTRQTGAMKAIVIFFSLTEKRHGIGTIIALFLSFLVLTKSSAFRDLRILSHLILTTYELGTNMIYFRDDLIEIQTK